MMDYACHSWSSTARTHIGRVQVLETKCLRLAAGARWVVSNWQVHGNLGVLLFGDHVRALAASFDSTLSDVENPYYGSSAGTYADRGLTPSPDVKAKGGRGQQLCRGHCMQWPI